MLARRVARLVLAVSFAASRARAQGEPTPPASSPAAPDSPTTGDDATPVVGLATAVDGALARNPTAVVAADEVRRAYALLEQARSASLPTLAAVGTYTHLDNDRRLPPPQGAIIAPANQVNGNITLTVPLIAPKSWVQWSHAVDGVDVAKGSAVDLRRLVAVAVARAYLTIVAQKRVVEAAARARDTDRAHYDFAHQRLVGGVGNRIDEVRANQQLQSDEANLQQQYANLARDREALGVLAGAGGPLDAEEPNLHATMEPGEAMKDAEQRSDVIAAGARLRAADHAVRDDWTDYSPYLSGVGSGIYQNPPTLSQPLTGWQVMAILNVPLYDGGLRYGQERERGALREEARVQLEGTLRQARSDVRTAFDEIRRADLALASARQGALLAHQALELAQLAYRAGAYTDIEVIDAERTARDADTAVAVAEDGSRQARLDLLAATGRFP
jgi:outer membrane protein TolC